ncbi:MULTISPECIES: HlyD family secretion protein [Nostocales]|uniref:hypothetical protein n=1 Tax=Nostocales TaxID=1161 RepID=UPI00067863A5
MNELNNILFAVYTTVLITIVTSQTPSNNTATASNSSENNYATSQKSVSSSQSSTKFVTNENRNLKVALTVDDPSFLKVKEGQKIDKGQILTDNSIERSRLTKQRQSIALQIQNLKSKKIPKPIAPNPPSQINPIPPANFAEEEAAIAQAQMKLTQALSLVEARTPLLKSENPERRAEVEKADAVFQQAAQKVEEQRQLLQSMRDLKLQDEIIQHEQAKLKALEGEQEQARSALKQAQAKLNASAIDQLQQLQQLQIAVRIAQSELELAQSRLLASQSRRQMVEYAANVNAAEREQKQQQLQQEYNRQLQFYSQALSDRDYQLAQLGISLTAIDDKLAQIPIVRSPQDGFIRRIQPWTGNNGKYSTTVIISDTVINKPSNPGASSSTNSSTTSTGTN